MISLVLRIATERIPELENIVGISASRILYGWELELIAESDNIPDAIERCAGLLSGKEELLSSIGIEKEHITLWQYYGYDHQCNIEFDAGTLHLLASLGLTFCISCWQNS